MCLTCADDMYGHAYIYIYIYACTHLQITQFSSYLSMNCSSVPGSGCKTNCIETIVNFFIIRNTALSQFSFQLGKCN